MDDSSGAAVNFLQCSKGWGQGTGELDLTLMPTPIDQQEMGNELASVLANIHNFSDSSAPHDRFHCILYVHRTV